MGKLSSLGIYINFSVIVLSLQIPGSSPSTYKLMKEKLRNFTYILYFNFLVAKLLYNFKCPSINIPINKELN